MGGIHRMKQTMKSCILEQPDTIRRVCQNAEKVCDSVYSIVGKGPFDKIYLIGSGTSLHTAIAAKYAFTKWFNAEVQVFTPFDFLYYYPHYRLDEKTLILGISQTARSIGTIHCLEKGREYGARTVMVTVMNAYVQPRMQKYVSQLRRRLDENGINSPLTIMQSSGGMMTDQIAAQKSVNTLLSGPAGGVLAAEFLSKITDYHNIITGDLGGTSFDVGIVQNGSIGITGEGVIEGFPVKFPHIDITTIGAGGGSIAWLDAGGALRVGPRSAGAVPGPVCYSKGGTEPTVTDAHAVLGRVGEKLLGGKMHLDVAAARKAIEEKLAVKLNMTVEEVAEGILRVANSNMVRAIRVMTVERGIDPRKFVLLPYGGAGALHAVELARTLDIGTVVIPIEPGNFSAFGLLVAPIRYDEVCTYHKHEKDVSFDHMEEKFEKLEAEARKEMARDGVSESSVSFERKIDIRYFGQAYELTISVPNSPVNQLVWDKLVNDFSDAHERSYGFKKNDPMELVSLRLSVVGEMDKSNLYSKGEISKELPKPEEIRKAYFMGEWLDTAVYKRDALKAGNSFIGPAIIEETGATSVVGPGDKVTVDERMNLVVKIANRETGKMEALEEN